MWWNWELDTDHYPNFDQLCKNLSETGTYLMTYVNPFLANTVTVRSQLRHQFGPFLTRF